MLHVHGETVAFHQLLLEIMLASAPEHLDGGALPGGDVEGVTHSRSVFIDGGDEVGCVRCGHEKDVLVSPPQIGARGYDAAAAFYRLDAALGQAPADERA